MSEPTPEPEAPADAPPAVAPWVSTQHEMEAAAHPLRTRLFRLKTRSGHLRLAAVTYFQASVRAEADARVEHLYRLQLAWLAEFDPRDGKASRFPERTTTGRPLNALQFRVLEMTTADGRRLASARLGPKGQIQAEPPGIGLMSLLRALLVEWVAPLHPDAGVLSGSLYQVDVQSEAERAVRDNFFVRSGFVVKPTSGGGGTFHAPALKSLRATWNPEKATELTPPLVADAVAAQLEAPHLRQQVAALQELLDAVTREKKATETLSRIWLAVTVVAVVLGLIFGIQPRLH